MLIDPIPSHHERGSVESVVLGTKHHVNRFVQADGSRFAQNRVVVPQLSFPQSALAGIPRNKECIFVVDTNPRLKNQMGFLLSFNNQARLLL